VFAATVATVISFEIVYFFKKISKIWEITIITITLIINIILIHFVFGLVQISCAIYLFVYSIILVIVLVWIGLKKMSKKERRFEKKMNIVFNRLTNKGIYFSGILSLLAGLLMFIFPEIFVKEIYEITHSLWHTFSAVGVAMILMAQKDFLLDWERKHMKKMWKHKKIHRFLRDV